MSFWDPPTCTTGYLVIYSVGEFLSKKTKRAVLSLLFACVLFLIGFWSGLLLKDITTRSDLVAVMANFGAVFIVTNIGMPINLEDLIRERKTVVISLLAITAIALICFIVGPLLFGREYALITAPSVAGSTVAGIIVTSAAGAANRPKLAAFIVLVLSVQKFFGTLISILCIREELRTKHGSGFSKSNTVEEKSNLKLPSMRISKETSRNLRSNTIYICKVVLMACIVDFMGRATLTPGFSSVNYILNSNITYLLFGLTFARIGFLEKGTFVRANSSGIITFSPLLMLPGSLTIPSSSGLLSMIVPVFGILLICFIGIIVICGIVGKVLGCSLYTSAAAGVTCMLAYPATQIITMESVGSFGWEGDERQKVMDYTLPKMITGDFVTVTIASVAFTGIIGPIIFQRKERLNI